MYQVYTPSLKLIGITSLCVITLCYNLCTWNWPEIFRMLEGPCGPFLLICYVFAWLPSSSLKSQVLWLVFRKRAFLKNTWWQFHQTAMFSCGLFFSHTLCFAKRTLACYFTVSTRGQMHLDVRKKRSRRECPRTRLIKQVWTFKLASIYIESVRNSRASFLLTTGKNGSMTFFVSNRPKLPE